MATDPSALFAAEAYLSYAIPAATPFSTSTLAVLREQHPSSAQALLESVRKREAVYFDETVTVLLVLRAPLTAGTDEEAVLRAHLDRVAVSLEATVVGRQSPDRAVPPNSYVVFSGSVDQGTEPFVVLDDEGADTSDGQEEKGDEEEQGGAEDEDNGRKGGDGEVDEDEGSQKTGENGGRRRRRRRWAYAAWTLPVFMARPRVRTTDPDIIFKASATLRAPKPRPSSSSSSSSSSSPSYLVPGRPCSLNLLASLAADPTMTTAAGPPARLSALRVSRVAPMTQARDPAVPLRSLQQVRLRLYPAIQTRMRFSRAGVASTSSSSASPISTRPSLIAVVEVDFTPFTDCEVLLDGIDLRADGAAVIEDLSSAVAGMDLPMRCVAHDHVTFMYRISPGELDAPPPPPLPQQHQEQQQQLEVTVRATALIEPGVCTPKLVMTWPAPLDFAAPASAGYGPAMQPIPAPRPGARDSASLLSSQLPAAFAFRPDSLPSLQEEAVTAVQDLGITMTFSAPAGPVAPGEVFAWTVHVVNRTSDRAPNAPPRRLALVALPRRRPWPAADMTSLRPPNNINNNSNNSKSNANNGKSRSGLAVGSDVASAVLDQTVVYAMQQGAQLEAADVLCLSADARVGPLVPGACQAVELRFMALREGILGIEAVRVMDLASQDHVDVRDLPVMVVERARG